MKSKHKRHLEILSKLVNTTDWYVSMAWDNCDSVVKGLLVRGITEDSQRFSVLCGCSYLRGARMKWSLRTPPFIQGGDIFFALQNRDSKKHGIVVKGWKELEYFGVDERVMEIVKEYRMRKGSENGKA